MNRQLLTLFLLFLVLSTSAQKVNVKGVVKNTSDSVVVFRVNEIDAITGEDDYKRYQVKLDHKGKFEISLPENSIREWIIEQGEDEVFLYICNGHNLNLVIDFTKDKNRLVASGKNASEVNFFNYLDEQSGEKYGWSFYQKLTHLSIDEALKARNRKALFQLKVLNDYRKAKGFSEQFYRKLKTLYKYEPYETTLVEQLGQDKGLKANVNFLLSLKRDGFNDDYAAKNSNEYNTLVEHYMQYKFNGLIGEVDASEFLNFGTGAELSGLTKQVFLARQMIIFTTADNNLYKQVHQKFKKEVKDPQLLSLVDKTRNKYLAKLNENILSKENVSQSRSLNEIFQKYRGKVIYLDLWASWCGPCKSEMPNSKKIKAKLKDQDVIFLYLAYQDKKENWLAARKELEIDGEHYLLNPQLVKEASQLFEISGIPHYVIIDKDGNIVNKHAGRPNEAYPELLKLLQSM
uniref:TlpA family protein disulfide reductase n=1 Tax=Pedobacter schmidteae TaxID=2201271 RepID=UPI000EAE266D|nr:TlpA disulfide reductase family protein [Pedobacter schmidteae]